MTNKSGTTESDKYITEWTKMMITIWQEKMLLLDLHNSDANSLYSSLIGYVTKSGTNSMVIEHFFNFYGIYIDKGTGKEMSKGNDGDLGFTPNREPKPWFNKKFYYYTWKLAERMAEINQQEVSYVLKDVIEGKGD